MDQVKIPLDTERDLIRFATQNRDQRFEIVNGDIVNMAPIGIRHNIVAGNIYRALFAFVTPLRLGYVFTDNLIYVLEHNPKTGIRLTRVPDGSFVRKERLPEKYDLSLPFPGAPDLAIEVLSPDDTAAEVLKRIRDYFAHGTEQVWVVYPEQREVHQCKRGESGSRIYAGTDEIEAETVLPGFRLSLSEIFAIPDLSD